MKLPLQIFFLFCILNVPFVYAQDIPGPMSPPSLVNDFAGIFSRSERDKLEETLKNYNDTTSTQIYVVTVKDLGGYDANTFATELGEKWGVGQKGKDNGVVILIKPKVGNSRGQSYIAVGYGLEEWLTDSRVGRIQDEYMIPYFQKNDYYGGVDAAVHVIMKMLSGQFQADEESDIEVMDVLYAIIILAVLFFVIYRSAKDNNGSNSGGSSRGGGFFPPIIGGGRGSGGSFGGGFGGGGGGSFGGGGAGRSW